jgi:hypothetical protein
VDVSKETLSAFDAFKGSETGRRAGVFSSGRSNPRRQPPCSSCMSIPARFKLVADEALVPSRDPGGAESPVWEIAQSVLRNARGPLRFLRVVLAMWAKKAGSEGDLAAVAGGYFAKLLVGPW